MSAQLTAPEEMVLKVLDFDPTLPCEAVDAAGRLVCGERASWVLRCKSETCRYSFVVCHGHKAEIIAKSLRASRTGCPKCRRFSRRLDDLMDILPLRGAL